MITLHLLRGVLSDLLELWHGYRTPILTLTLILLLVARLLLYLNYRPRDLSAKPTTGAESPIKLRDISPSTERKHEFTIAKSVEVNPAENAIIARQFRIQRREPKRVGGRKPPSSKRRTSGFDPDTDQIQPLIFFSSIGGSTEYAAKKLQGEVDEWITNHKNHRVLTSQLHDLSYIEYDDYFTAPPRKPQNTKYFYMMLVPTYDIDTVLNTFLEHLKETHNDFRIDTAPLSSLLGYSVFGFGDRESWPTEEEGFCSQAKEVDKWMAKLTARKRAFPVGMGDVKQDATERLEEWRHGVQEALLDIAAGKGLGEGVPGSGDAVESDEEDVGVEDEKQKTSLDDLEDIGKSYRKEAAGGTAALAVDFTTYKPSKGDNLPAEPKQMVPASSPTYAALTKQGYTIVGSHSGVKICRWTKSALRGRGSCYKYSFYGIHSHLCMEATPSLSCSNKCVFCWRHGTNPVGTTWRWAVDPPELIFAGAKEGHYRKIRALKGVPGLRADRFAAALRIRHCALSLVGEPIFYPRINELLALLHAERISTFLVCNAQHPAHLAALGPVTQLYVSVDAPDAAALRAIDRPLHRDYWARFTQCLDIVRARRRSTRTVFRLTLVLGFNMAPDQVAGYADLVARGGPCFVEAKGVTFCGTSASAAAGIRMSNVPFYADVARFSVALLVALRKRGMRYGIAAEHAHSCCILLADESFRVDGRWRSRIDYDKFFDCLESGREFGPEDYMGEETPEWALWGNGGFDPRDERVDRKGNKKVVEMIDYKGIEAEFGL